jgi:hypothetical protein
MRTITMTEKRKITVAKILESEQLLTITSHGRVIGYIRPNKDEVAKHRREHAAAEHSKRKSQERKRLGC